MSNPSNFLPPKVWPSKVLPPPKTSDALGQIAHFLRELGYSKTVKALTKEAESKDSSFKSESWPGTADGPLGQSLGDLYVDAFLQDDSSEDEDEAANDVVNKASEDDESRDDDSEDDDSEDDESETSADLEQSSAHDTKEDSSDNSSDSDGTDSEEDEATPVKIQSVKPIKVEANKPNMKRKRESSVDSSDNDDSDSSSEGTSSSESESEDDSDEESSVSVPPSKRTKVEISKPDTDEVMLQAEDDDDDDDDDDSSDSDSEDDSSEESSEEDDESTSEATSEDTSSSEESEDDDDDNATIKQLPAKKSSAASSKTTSALAAKRSDFNETDSTSQQSSATLTASPIVQPVEITAVSISSVHPDRQQIFESTVKRQSSNGKNIKGNQPFSRIPKDTVVDPRFASNEYVSYDYADRAYQDLSVTKGRGFTKEKNKKKRGSYRGGAIDITPKGIKFDD